MLSYQAETYISAEPTAVWKVLMDLSDYPEWDPGIQRVSGALAHGSKITIYPTSRPDRSVHARVTELIENLRMAWTSGLPLGLFRGVRTFTLKPTTDGGTDVVVEEVFSGPLLRVRRRSVPDLQPLFEQFVAGLKARVEGDA